MASVFWSDHIDSPRRTMWRGKREGRREVNKQNKTLIECLVWIHVKAPALGLQTKEIAAERLNRASEAAQLVHGLNLSVCDAITQKLATALSADFLQRKADFLANFPIEEKMLLPVHTNQLGSHVSWRWAVSWWSQQFNMPEIASRNLKLIWTSRNPRPVKLPTNKSPSKLVPLRWFFLALFRLRLDKERTQAWPPHTLNNLFWDYKGISPTPSCVSNIQNSLWRL